MYVSGLEVDTSCGDTDTSGETEPDPQESKNVDPRKSSSSRFLENGSGVFFPVPLFEIYQYVRFVVPFMYVQVPQK